MGPITTENQFPCQMLVACLVRTMNGVGVCVCMC